MSNNTPHPVPYADVEGTEAPAVRSRTLAVSASPSVALLAESSRALHNTALALRRHAQGMSLA